MTAAQTRRIPTSRWIVTCQDWGGEMLFFFWDICKVPITSTQTFKAHSATPGLLDTHTHETLWEYSSKSKDLQVEHFCNFSRSLLLFSFRIFSMRRPLLWLRHNLPPSNRGLTSSAEETGLIIATFRIWQLSEGASTGHVNTLRTTVMGGLLLHGQQMGTKQ